MHRWRDETVGLIGVWAMGRRHRGGGVLGPFGRRKDLYAFYLIFPFISPDFLRVELCDSFAGHVAAQDATDEITLIGAHRSRGL